MRHPILMKKAVVTNRISEVNIMENKDKADIKELLKKEEEQIKIMQEYKEDLKKLADLKAKKEKLAAEIKDVGKKPSKMDGFFQNFVKRQEKLDLVGDVPDWMSNKDK